MGLERAVIVRPGEGRQVANVEFLARTADANRTHAVARIVDVHAPAGFDLRVED